MKVFPVTKLLLKNWMRNKSGVFFTVLFPIMLILIFGSIFGQSKMSYTVYIQNKDAFGRNPTKLAKEFIDALNNTTILKIKKLDVLTNPKDFVKDHLFRNCRVIVIPRGFQDNILRGKEVDVEVIGRKGDPYFPLVKEAVETVACNFNLRISRSGEVINVSSSFTTEKKVTTIDYYVPSILAAFIMVNGVISVASSTAEFRSKGVMKKVMTAPVSKYEWIAGNLLQQVLLAFLLTLAMIGVAKAAFNFNRFLDCYSILFIAVGAVAFCALGLLIGNAVGDVEAASGMANAIAFPMMFLSGAFWPVELMPKELQFIAKIMPLYYLQNGLRIAMVYGKFNSTSFAGILVSAIVFVAAAVSVTKWRVD